MSVQTGRVAGQQWKNVLLVRQKTIPPSKDIIALPMNISPSKDHFPLKENISPSKHSSHKEYCWHCSVWFVTFLSKSK